MKKKNQSNLNQLNINRSRLPFVLACKSALFELETCMSVRLYVWVCVHQCVSVCRWVGGWFVVRGWRLGLICTNDFIIFCLLLIFSTVYKLPPPSLSLSQSVNVLPFNLKKKVNSKEKKNITKVNCTLPHTSLMFVLCFFFPSFVCSFFHYFYFSQKKILKSQKQYHNSYK